MSAKVNGSVRTFPNNAALGRGVRVAMVSGYLAAAGINSDELGVMDELSLSTDGTAPVRLPNSGETVRGVAATAITQYAEVYAAASGKVSATVSGPRWGIALEAASGDGSEIEILRLPAAGGGGQVITEEVTFTEDGDTTYTGSVNVPAGATLLDVIVHAVALWDDGTSASLNVGDVADPNGFFAAVNLKATDLLAGESIGWGYTGGKEGADVDGGESAGDHLRRRYLATARVISGVITTGGQNGTAGRTRLTVVYSLPNVTAATGAEDPPREHDQAAPCGTETNKTPDKEL